MPIELKLSEDVAKMIASEIGTPYQLYDEKMILENLEKFLKNMSENFINFRQYFAVKALPNPSILKLLYENGCFLDCSSLNELKMAESLGIKGEGIMFTSNYTSKGDLEYATELDCIINLDDISLLKDLVEIKVPDIICFRLNPGIGKTNSETKSNILGGKDAKFGIPSFQIVEAYKLAKSYNIKRFGIHMMSGSNITDLNYWKELIEILFENINNIFKETSITFEFINIGGGIGIPYRQEEKEINLDDLITILKSSISLMEDKYSIKCPKLYMENGRYITGPYGWLVSKCNVIKNTYEKYYGLDACMSNLMRPGMYGAYHYISIIGKELSQLSKANVVGTLCENNDWFAKGIELPEGEIGDLFVIHDTGAHSHSMGFQYNGKLRAPELLIKENGSIQLIRRRETFEDYNATIVLEDLPFSHFSKHI